ncbi:DUF2752 domain-containing protein [Aestuariivivens marinum]|uniref:DUF2752 domain-containing protein n=1 Tax=Aestuariivivens marinum TaxID=2913555 RepID=UPI001F5A3F51|nr:DUF2752 domain-containing protein [Aestuariivivens marinum]
MSGFDDYMLPCLNKKLFGIECMGCGLQRSASLVTQGEFVDAFYMYPAIYTLILLLIVIVFNTFKKFKYNNKIITILAILNIVIIVTNFVSKLI